MKGVIRWIFRNYPHPDQRKRVNTSYKNTFEGQHAADVLEDLRRFCNVYDTTLLPDDPSGLLMAANEGKRQAYMHIVSMLEVSPSELKTNQKERTDERDEERPIDTDE